MILVNGEYKTHIPVTDRGFQYGDGLFETIEVKRGQTVFLEQHIDRLCKGCIRLHIPAPSLDILRFEITSLCNKFNTSSANTGDCVLKIIITRGSGGRGYRQPDIIEPTRIISVHPWPDYPQDYAKQGITARFCQTRVGLNPLLAGLKHLNRLEQVMARAEWNDPDIQEGFMLDLNGHIIEGTMSNVFLVKDGVLHTPTLFHSGIAGIIRGLIIELAHCNHIAVSEHLFFTEALLSADEVFITNSIIGIWPIKQIETTTYCVGPVTQQLQIWLHQFKLDQLNKEWDDPNV
jgi:4-amino-4-deoxychorismate lyase